MSHRFEDFAESNSAKEVRIACPLGDKCTHATVEECDVYRQKLLEEEHKNKCGPNCEHFRNPVKGIPATARHQGMNPAEFLLKSRGL
jgi:hypothetical protein